MSEAVIQLEQVGKAYGGIHRKVTALADITFDISQGEFVSIIGASGSGKSTLLHIIGCLDVPTSGRYLLTQQSVQECSSDRLAEIRNQKIGFVFQSFYLLPRCTAVENVMMPMRYGGVSPKDQRRRTLELLNWVGLSHRADHVPSELSGGEQQRVAVARALANQPKVLLADEPTGNLDTETGGQILTLFKKLRETFGTTVVVVTHDMKIAEQADWIIALKDGKRV